MCINVESLIREVQNKRELWDYSLEEFKDKKAKRLAWEDVNRALVFGYDELSDIEQENLGREIQMKWKNLKDSYKRNLRSQIEKGHTPNGKLFSTYIYSESMSFLKFEDLPIEIEMLNIPNEVDDSNCFIQSQEIEQDTYFPVKRKYSRKQRNSKEVDSCINDQPNGLIEDTDFLSQNGHNKSVLPVLNDDVPNCENFYCPDEDVAFFSSIMPTVRSLTFDEKLQFRMDILQVLTDIKKKHENKLKRKRNS